MRLEGSHYEQTDTASENPNVVHDLDNIESHEVFSEFPAAEIFQEGLGRFGTMQL